MAYFFDTSALVKRYHQENGTAVVDAAIENTEHSCLISDTVTVHTCPGGVGRQRAEMEWSLFCSSQTKKAPFRAGGTGEDPVASSATLLRSGMHAH